MTDTSSVSSTSTTPATTTAPHIQAIIDQFLGNLFGNLFKDEAAVFQPVADTYLGGILSSPDPNTLVLQSLAYQTQALAVLPKAASVGIYDTAAAIKTFIDANVPALVAQVTTATAALAAGQTASNSAGTGTTAGMQSAPG